MRKYFDLNKKENRLKTTTTWSLSKWCTTKSTTNVNFIFSKSCCDHIKTHMLPYSLMVSFVSLSSFSINQRFFISKSARKILVKHIVCAHLWRHILSWLLLWFRIIGLSSCSFFSFGSPFFSFTIIYGEYTRMNRFEMQLSNTKQPLSIGK